MSLLVKPGIDRLSQLTIDADKNWEAMGITNIRQVAEGMLEGDLVVRNADRLARLPAGSLGHVLTSAGPGHIPSWLPAPDVLETYIPVWIYTDQNEDIVVVAKSVSKDLSVPAPDLIHTYIDAPADLVKRIDQEVGLDDSEDIVAVDKSHDQDADIDSECAIEHAVGGAVLDDGGVETDYTVDINDPGTANVKLLPDAPLQVDDAFYFGFEEPWGQLRLNIHIAATGNYMLVEEYWDGAAWTLLTILRESTGEFRIAGVGYVRWTVPEDWELTTIQGKNLYWMRFRVANVVDYTAQPYARQGWCEVLA